jgi:thioredoxin reductase
MDLPLHGKVKLTDTSKGELLELWEGILSKHGIEIREHTKVEAITRDDRGVFELATAAGTVRAQRVVLAIGRRGTPRKLGVPGEEGNERVAYRLLDPELIEGEDILVVGGGDSAVEAVFMLMDANRVRLSYRKENFARIKPGNRTKLEQAMAEGRFEPCLATEVKEIGSTHVSLVDASGDSAEIPADRIFIFAGGELPTEFLRKSGIEVEKTFGKIVRKHGKS